MLVGIGEGGTARPRLHPDMHQFAQTAAQTIADLTQRLGLGQLTEQHGHEVRPTRKPLGATLRTMLAHQPYEYRPRKLVKQLTKQ